LEPYRLQLKVRDYECDMQGIVNNSVYQNFLEHARHEFLIAKNMNFAEITRLGIHLVVTRVEIDYLKPLVSGDEFYVTARCERKGRLRFVFHQEIYRQSDNTKMLSAIVTGTSINENGRPIKTDLLGAICE